MESPDYRNNLELILERSNGKAILNLSEVRAVTGLRDNRTVRNVLGIKGNHISAPTLARLMSGRDLA